MSQQICPNCKTKNIIWSIDDEESPLTLWRCENCGYEAYENETKATDCPACGTEKMNALIKDAKGFHRWCSRCNLYVLTEDRFEIRREE